MAFSPNVSELCVQHDHKRGHEKWLKKRPEIVVRRVRVEADDLQINNNPRQIMMVSNGSALGFCVPPSFEFKFHSVILCDLYSCDQSQSCLETSGCS